MQGFDSSFALGRPDFQDQKINEISQSESALLAWRAALNIDVEKAASTVGGDFSVGVHLADGRTYLAVDRFAVQSMCYKISEGVLLFSSRLDELVDETSEVDPQAIFDYLYFHIIPSPRTIYKGISRLPPGHFAVFKEGQLTVAPYWSPNFQNSESSSFDSLKQEFIHVLKEAVTAQIEEFQPACFLSGGTDSSTVAGMAAAVSGRTTAAYSIGFAVPGYDEISYAQLAAHHFKLEHHIYYITPDDLVKSIPNVAHHFEQPFGNSSVLPAYYCAKMARENGVNKLLAGDGGDELFGGNTRYARQALFNRYNYVPEILRNSLIEPLMRSRSAQAWKITRKVKSYVEQASTPMPERLQMYNLLVRLGSTKIFTQKFLNQVDTSCPLQLQKTVWDSVKDISALNQELAFDWRFTLSENDLPKVTGAGQLANMKIGFPLLNKGLLEFSQKLPGHYKLKGQQLRWFFKESLRDFLPAEILNKKKQGFSLPFGVWATSHSGLKKMTADTLASLSNRGIVRTDLIQILLTQHLPEHPGYYGEMVWILVMLEQWIQSHAPKFKI